jgi:protein-tyrosine phosphatase
LGITHIINLTRHFDNKFENEGFKYLNIRIEDNDKFTISDHFKEAYEFIDKALLEDIVQDVESIMKEMKITNFSKAFDNIRYWNERNKLIQLFFKNYFDSYTKNRVLVHCSMGVSRSPTICIMYIMKKLQLSHENVFIFKIGYRVSKISERNFLSN